MVGAFSSGFGAGDRGQGLGLTSILALIAGATWWSAGRYPRPLFDFLMGLYRWSWRVVAYAALLRDEYPPFRLDMGPDEPVSTVGEATPAP